MKKYLIVKEEPMAGFSLSNILRLLIHNKFRIHVKYLPRFMYALFVATLSSPLRIIEFIRFHRKIKKVKINKDPIFIIGHWRSGTTYLHYLMFMDKSKDVVTNKETYCPHFFLAFPKFVNWLLTNSLPETRPMDKVIINPDLPGEEEHSMGAYDKFGFFHSMIFPRNFDKYMNFLSFDDCPQRNINRWEKRYYYLLQKVTMKAGGKRLILKNPANSYRINLLYKMFPNAKFIHIHRNPYEVYKSSIRFHEKTCEIFALQSWDSEKLKNGILQTYKELYEKFDEKKKSIPEENFIDIPYKDFLKDPLKYLKKIYDQFNLEDFDENKKTWQDYIDAQKKYHPADYEFSKELIKNMNRECDYIFEKFGYEKL